MLDPRRNRTTTLTGLAAALIALTVTTSTGAPLGAQQVFGCEPQLVSGSVAGADAPPTGIERRTGHFPYPVSWGTDNVDTDGDGAPDDIQVIGDTVVVTSAAGRFEFAEPGLSLWAGGVGDLDGIRGDEIGVFALRTDVVSSVGAPRAWVVPGATPAGTLRPSAVGIDIGTGAPFAIADRDGDGTAEVLAIDHTGPGVWGGSTRVLSGEAVMATPVGAQVPAAAVLATLPGTVDAFVPPEDSMDQDDAALTERQGAIATVQVEDARVVVRLWDGAVPAVYSTGPEHPVRFMPEVGSSGGGLNLAVDHWTGDVEWLSLEVIDDSLGARTYWWRLDTCGASIGPGPTTTAPAAAPTTTPATAVAPMPSPSRPAAPVAAPAAARPGRATFAG